MNAEQYRAVIGWFNARPAAKKALRLVSRSAVALVYLLYLGMLAWLAWHRMGQLLFNVIKGIEQFQCPQRI